MKDRFVEQSVESDCQSREPITSPALLNELRREMNIRPASCRRFSLCPVEAMVLPSYSEVDLGP